MSAKKLLAAALGAIAATATVASPAAAASSAADCTTYQFDGSGTFRPGYESFPWSYFWSEGDEEFAFCVDIPDTAEVVADVREFSVPNQQWETVLTAPSGPGDKEFTYHVDKGATYRLYVTGVSGSGAYQAGITFSRLE